LLVRGTTTVVAMRLALKVLSCGLSMLHVPVSMRSRIDQSWYA